MDRYTPHAPQAITVLVVVMVVVMVLLVRANVVATVSDTVTMEISAFQTRGFL
jgi:sensor histidine kinase regulating citrate/malate metabolism